MCGIVGYSGFKNAKDIVIDGLKTLEYRGYDSAGVALLSDTISVYKTVGNVTALVRELPSGVFHTAIGHTRWATHGKPSAKNAHPHLSFDGRIAIVHNGVIENCEELKAELEKKGIRLVSDTDSEIIAHLLALENVPMINAIENVGKRLKGAATFLAICEGDDAIYVRKKNASIAVGIGENESFAASDTLALCGYVEKSVILKDGECAVLRGGNVEFFKDGERIKKQPAKISRTPVEPCSCHMRAEIDEIPRALARTYESITKSHNEDFIERFHNVKRLFLTGCGTAYHAALYGAAVFEDELSSSEYKGSKFFCKAVEASEFDRIKDIDSDSAVIAITQSGETADTLNALDKCRECGAYSVVITNVPDSSATFAADKTFLLDAGAEVAVAATKSYNCQLLALYVMARELIGNKDVKPQLSKLLGAIDLVSSYDLYEERIKNNKMFFIGKGVDGITAKEAALKFKEITYKMTDAYSAGELKHGPIALIDKDCTVIVVASGDRQRLRAAISELRSRGAYTVALSSVSDVGADKSFYLPTLSDDMLFPLLGIIPLQSLALSASLCLGLDPDKPRNLAKSVTVI